MVLKKVRRCLAVVMAGAVILTTSGADIYAQSTNIYSSKEDFQIHYTGKIQFKGSYKTNKNSGYGLKSGKHVKRAFCEYTRNGKNVSGGRKYTTAASDTNDSKIRVATCSAWDDLRWGSKYTTVFSGASGWIYFD